MFEVRWERKALGELADLWLQAVDREAVNAAVDKIDEALAASAETVGESRVGNDRFAFFPPLSVTFEVDARARVVLILQVHAPRRRA